MSGTILITGSSSGIGRATANYFSAKGWNVIATMRSPEKERELIHQKNILVTKLDVQQPATIAEAVEKGIAKFGGIDVLINNAGYGEFGIFEATARENINMQFEINVFGIMDTIRTILPHFRERNAGTIINISSGAGKFTIPMISLYAASKFALEGFSEALSYELGELNIHVKIVEPGGTATNFNKVSGEKVLQNVSIPAYDKFVTAAGKMFDEMKGMQLATSDEVAAVIYQAATDNTDTLRYIVGNDDFKSRLVARATMPDQDYLNAIKSGYQKFM
jgi:NAD(P)-dependent dehydrogenase (short-subunit alcohol dehydrogenase family)